MSDLCIGPKHIGNNQIKWEMSGYFIIVLALIEFTWVIKEPRYYVGANIYELAEPIGNSITGLVRIHKYVVTMILIYIT